MNESSLITDSLCKSELLLALSIKEPTSEWKSASYFEISLISSFNSLSFYSSLILTLSNSTSFCERFYCNSFTFASFYFTSVAVSSIDLISYSFSFSSLSLSAFNWSILAWTSSIWRLALAYKREMSSRYCAICLSSSFEVFFSHLIFSTTTSWSFYRSWHSKR